MPITAPIPMPDQPGEALAKGSDWMNKLLAAPIDRQQTAANAEHQRALAAMERSPEKYALLRAQIEAEQALAHQRKTGGGGIGGFGAGSAGFKDISSARNYIMQTRGIGQKESDELINRAMNGEDVGLTPIELAMMDQIKKRGTTSALITQGVKGAQAEAEMPIIDKAISEGRQPYGNTVMGFSMAQIKDTFNPDEKAQTRIGNNIASDLLSFDKAALQARMAGTESGVTILNEVMDKAKQTINARYPMLKDKARQVALDKVSKVLKEALHARQSIPMTATGAQGGLHKSQEASFAPSSGQNNMASFLLPDGKRVVEIPAENADEFASEHPDHKRLSG